MVWVLIAFREKMPGGVEQSGRGTRRGATQPTIAD